jgi:hypothetical protein
MVERGRVVFKEMIYCDSKLDEFKMYSDINTVCFGFSKLIVDKLINIKNEKDKMEKVIKYF